MTDATRSGDRNGIPAHVLESPTPVAGHNVSLQHAVRLWPTPRAGDSEAGPELERTRSGANLRTAVDPGARWPTPGVQGPNSGGGSSKPRTGHQVNISDAVKIASLPMVESWNPDSLWPTPRASEWKGTGPLGPLNPDWVEWLMGFPIGWTDLEVDDPVILPGDPWPPDPSPGIPRMAKDVVRRKQRLMQLGNAVVPQIPEILGHELRELLATVDEED